MIAKETKRRTDKVHTDMSEVIVNEGPLSAVARGIQDVNETLAVHAAWTEERFEGVEERLGGLELGQQAIRDDVAGLPTKIDGGSTRVGNLEIAFVGMRADMVRMETRIRGDIDRLAVRVDRVLSVAINDELKLAASVTDEDGNA